MCTVHFSIECLYVDASNLQEWFIRLNIGKSPLPPDSPNIIVFVFKSPANQLLRINLKIVWAKKIVHQFKVDPPIAHIISSSVKLSLHL